MSRPFLFTLILVFCACSACEKTPAGDRADATINRVALTDPAVLIGNADGHSGTEFGRIADLEVSRDGNIYVADAQAKEVRAFHRSGSLKWVSGRAGRGPGEYTGVNRLWAAGDTLVVEDIEGARLTLLDATGSVIGTYPLWTPDRSRLFLLGRSAEGWYGEVRQLGVPGAAGSANAWAVPLTQLWLIDPDSGTSERQLFSVSHPDSANPENLFSGLRQGGTVAGDRVFLTVQAQPYEIHVYNLDGRVERVIRRAFIPRRVDKEWIKDARERIGRYYRDNPVPPGWTGGAEKMLARLDAVEIGATVAPIQGLLAGTDGSVWIRRLDLQDDLAAYVLEFLGAAKSDGGPFPRSYWDVFDGRGLLTAEVVLTGGFRPLHVTETAVTGVHTDGLGVERVARFELPRDL